MADFNKAISSAKTEEEKTKIVSFQVLCINFLCSSFRVGSALLLADLSLSQNLVTSYSTRLFPSSLFGNQIDTMTLKTITTTDHRLDMMFFWQKSDQQKSTMTMRAYNNILAMAQVISLLLQWNCVICELQNAIACENNVVTHMRVFLKSQEASKCSLLGLLMVDQLQF